MPKFAYVAKNKEGRTMRGDLEAPDKKSAIEVIRSRDMLMIRIDELKKRESIISSLMSSSRRKVPMDELVIFVRQMATMTGAGITIVNALDTMGDQVAHARFKKVILDVRDSVNTGASLSDAMAKHSSVFSEFFVNMVKAGESSGMLDEVLERVATYMEKTHSLQRKIRSAMVYPAVVSFLALVITFVLILRVIPVFKDMFSGFGAELPGPTQFLINVSDIVRSSFWLLAIGVIGVGSGVKWYINTAQGRLAFDGLKLKLPVFGPLFKKVAISKFSRTLSTLVRSGVPILSALEIVAKTAGNVVVERSVYAVKESVKEGESIATPMEKSGIFPPLVTRMISVGEKSGELEKMLSKIADFYDDQVSSTVDSLTSLIEPFVIVFLGVIIGGIVISMFLPIFKMGTLIEF